VRTRPENSCHSSTRKKQHVHMAGEIDCMSCWQLLLDHLHSCCLRCQLQQLPPRLQPLLMQRPDHSGMDATVRLVVSESKQDAMLLDLGLAVAVVKLTRASRMHS